MSFVVRSPLAASSSDPATLYTLRNLEAKKDHREVTFTVGHVSGFLASSTSTNFQQGMLPLKFKRYGTASYEVSTEGLLPGEYALGPIAVASPLTLFCFGVESPPKSKKTK
jgi:hypothetical protein